MLQVHEIFHSIQGEGPFMGRPGVFLRLGGCLKPYCDFCDTPEALTKGRPMRVNDVLSEIISHGCPLVIITGGEPFLQWADGLSELEDLLLARGLEIQYESSGRGGLPDDVRGQVVLSPKPGQWPDKRTLFKALALKVLWQAESSSEILAAIDASGFPAEKVWLMALGASRAEQLAHMPLLWEVCRVHGYQLSPRLHVLAFDRQKGI